MKCSTAVVLTAMFAAGIASAQSTLMEPNNSAGSPLDTPPLIVPPPSIDAASSNTKAVSRSDSSAAAFQKLDPNGNGYVTRSDFARLRGSIFDAADFNNDGRVTYEEFQRYWTDVQSGHD